MEKYDKDNSNTDKGTTKNNSYNKEPETVHTRQDENYNDDKPNTDTGTANITIPSNEKEIESNNTKSKISKGKPKNTKIKAKDQETTQKTHKRVT